MNTEGGGQTFSHQGGEQTIIHKGGGQTFLTHGRGGTNIFALRGGTNIFCWRHCDGGYDDVDEEMDVSEAHFLVNKANIPVSEDSKLFTGARICMCL